MYPWLEPYFNALITRYHEQKLHHGLLFMGSADVGKTQLCQSVAKALLCKLNKPAASEPQVACGNCKSCSLIEAGSHPDLHVITTEKSQIGIDAIRQTISKVSQTAQLSGNKVVIIGQVELMSESASNALLKTLEEPTANTYILMTTNESQRLLPTILSRCEKLSIALPTLEQSIQWLNTQNIATPSKAAMLAHGSSPLTYKRELECPDIIGFDDFVAALQQLKAGSDSANRAALRWQTHASKVTKWLAQYWIEIYQESQSEEAFQNYQSCVNASKRMNHPGLNKSLILTTLFAQLRPSKVRTFS